MAQISYDEDRPEGERWVFDPPYIKVIGLGLLAIGVLLLVALCAAL